MERNEEKLTLPSLSFPFRQMGSVHVMLVAEPGYETNSEEAEFSATASLQDLILVFLMVS